MRLRAGWQGHFSPVSRRQPSGEAPPASSGEGGLKVLQKTGIPGPMGELATYRTVLVCGKHGAAGPKMPCFAVVFGSGVTSWD